MARASSKTTVVSDWRDQLQVSTLCIVLAAVGVIASVALDLPTVVRALVFVGALVLFGFANASLRRRVVVTGRVVVVQRLWRRQQVPVKEIITVDARSRSLFESPRLVLRGGRHVELTPMRWNRLFGRGRSIRRLGTVLDVDVTDSSDLQPGRRPGTRRS